MFANRHHGLKRIEVQTKPDADLPLEFQNLQELKDKINEQENQVQMEIINSMGLH